jgi:hypothetical protein
MEHVIMSWQSELFSETRRTEADFRDELRQLAGLLPRSAWRWDHDDVAVTIDATEAAGIGTALDAGGWTESEEEYAGGFTFTSATSVEGRGLMASFDPASERLELSIVEVEEAEVGTPYDQMLLIRVGDVEFMVPDTATVRCEAYDDDREYGLYAYPTGTEFELLTEAGWVPALLVARVWTIPEENIEAFIAKFDKMAKKAVALEAAVPTWQELGRFRADMRSTKERTRQVPPYYRNYIQVVVHGEGPRLKGWRFLGVIDPGEGELGEGMYLLNMVPGEEIPDRFKIREEVNPFWCDHCQTIRRRKTTFIVANEETGEVLQVGSSCIRDFLGHTAPQQIAQYLQWLDEAGAGLDEDEDYGGGGYGGPRAYDLETFLAYTVRSIGEFGWMSRGKARDTMEQATSDHVLEMISDAGQDPEELQAARRRFRAAITDEDHAAAIAALEWSPTLWSEESDYGLNMEAALSGDTVSYTTAGLVASLIMAHQRELGRLRERELRAQIAADSYHLGTVGQREAIPAATILSTQIFENEWGSTTLIKMLTDDGAQLAWWYGGSDEYEEDDRYGGTCGIKKHGDFQGVPETTVQRCSLQRLDWAFAKLTAKQADALEALGVSRFDAREGKDIEQDWAGTREDLEAGLDLRLVERELVIEPEGVATLQALLPQIAALPRVGKGIVKKIDAALAASDLGNWKLAAGYPAVPEVTKVLDRLKKHLDFDRWIYDAFSATFIPGSYPIVVNAALTAWLQTYLPGCKLRHYTNDTWDATSRPIDGWVVTVQRTNIGNAGDFGVTVRVGRA